MDTKGMEQRLIEQWQQAARDLDIHVTAQVELRDASGQPFTCEAWVHDFGSPTGAVVVSRKTERCVRPMLRTVGNALWVSGSGPRLTGHNRRHFIEVLLDWGWFGEAGGEPGWYSQRMPHSG